LAGTGHVKEPRVFSIRARDCSRIPLYLIVLSEVTSLSPCEGFDINGRWMDGLWKSEENCIIVNTKTLRKIIKCF
jgi:hypothetical protein